MNLLGKLGPSWVEYRTFTNQGERVVRVDFSLKTPRLISYSESLEGHLPMSLFEDELFYFLEDSKRIWNSSHPQKRLSPS